MTRKPKFVDGRTGRMTRLECPECGDFCRTIRPHRRTPEYPYPHFEDGDAGVCACGASLVVKADGERAWLHAPNDEHNNERWADLGDTRAQEILRGER